MLNQALKVHTDGKAKKSQFIAGAGYRITVLTSRLFRIEIAEDKKVNEFDDLATQVVWFRNLPEVPFTTESDGHFLYVRTDDTELKFDTGVGEALTVTFLSEDREVDVGYKGNLRGTRRTLDRTAGKAHLGHGLVSKDGVSVLDDTDSLLLNEDGQVIARSHHNEDYYVFAYGRDYRACINAYYMLTGGVPLVPRYALGNWWSRYKAYTQDEYIKLMRRFSDEDVPLTVAAVDMDWHWTDLNKKFGTDYKKRKFTGDDVITGGWTGYSWNTDLFPDYHEFLDTLNDMGLKVTLNLHPADGVRHFESMYPQMAKAMGIDPETKKDIPFSASDPNYLNAFYDTVLRPYEEDGVAFWWLDWQQGKKSDLEGLDPLWSVNHYSYLSSASNGRIPLILSRYSGYGSHRYPIGFSGDTAIKWAALNFQPHFTATAANVGYTWWSHDIGGHMMGARDDELYVRWVQFGAFSPILRLHSTSNELLSKEPWLYRSDYSKVAEDFLRLRHRMIPYLYTMDYRTHKEGIALCEPMYYQYPQEEDAYSVPNEYRFGSELIVCPITHRISEDTFMGSAKVFVPEGRWTDIFTGRSYNGPSTFYMSRDITSIPVLACEGAIIPLSSDAGNSAENPQSLELWIWRGSNTFDMYEDYGTVDFEHNRVFTSFSVNENDERLKFTVSPAVGYLSAIPASRSYLLTFKDIMKVHSCTVYINGEVISELKNDGEITSEKTFSVRINDVKPADTVEVVISDYEAVKDPSLEEAVEAALSKWQKGNGKKARVLREFTDSGKTEEELKAKSGSDKKSKKALRKATSKKALKKAARAEEKKKKKSAKSDKHVQKTTAKADKKLAGKTAKLDKKLAKRVNKASKHSEFKASCREGKEFRGQNSKEKGQVVFKTGQEAGRQSSEGHAGSA